MTRQCNIQFVTDYRLRPVREARDRDERVRRSDLAAATREARETTVAVERARARVAATAAAIAETRARAATTSNELALIERYLGRLRRDLEAARIDEARALAVQSSATEVVDAARLRLVAARAAKQVIVRHFDRWRAEQRKLAERREE